MLQLSQLELSLRVKVLLNRAQVQRPLLLAASGPRNRQQLNQQLAQVPAKEGGAEGGATGSKAHLLVDALCPQQAKGYAQGIA